MAAPFTGHRLVDRNPHVSAEALLRSLVPPPLFESVTFDSYVPDPAEPTQAAAVAALRAFAARPARSSSNQQWWRRGRARPESRAGVYLDGGFGVGKTHLLAALWHECEGARLFATFVELSYLVGALGFADAIARLKSYHLVCIDEFELDDPGDTVLMSTLLQALADDGVRLAATSNTLPDRLGEDRFAAADFLREIHGLAAHFDVIRVDGPDYRHRVMSYATVPTSEADIELVVSSASSPAVDEFGELLAHLANVHPSQYGALVANLDLVAWLNVRVIEDQAAALRLVVLVDRLYDRGVTVMGTGVPLGDIFSEEMLRGGYRKKYFRALSRLLAMAP
ncbi:MAG: cell division protein ZapE [Actinomycetes bacterium]